MYCNNATFWGFFFFLLRCVLVSLFEGLSVRPSVRVFVLIGENAKNDDFGQRDASYYPFGLVLMRTVTLPLSVGFFLSVFLSVCTTFSLVTNIISRHSATIIMIELCIFDESIRRQLSLAVHRLSAIQLRTFFGQFHQLYCFGARDPIKCKFDRDSL